MFEESFCMSFLGRFPDSPHELYNLKLPPLKAAICTAKRSTRKRRQRCQERLAAFFMKNADPKYDLWHEGKSQTKLLGRERFPGRWYPPK